MKKIILVLLSTVLMLSTVVGCKQANSIATIAPGATTSVYVDVSLQKVLDSKKFILGLDDSFPPLGFRNDKNEVVGFDIDLAKEVCKRLGVELVIQSIDWAAKDLELKSGKIDCIWNGMTITDERKEAMNLTKAYMNNRQVLIVRKGDPITKKEDLAGKKIALQTESSAEDALTAAVDFKASLKEVVTFENNANALLDLEAKNVEAVLLDETVARYYIETNKKDFVVLDESLASEEYGIGFRKDDKLLADKVWKTLEEMAADGKVSTISTTWFGKDITTIK